MASLPFISICTVTFLGMGRVLESVMRDETRLIDNENVQNISFVREVST